jgi:hypothetical protein
MLGRPAAELIGQPVDTVEDRRRGRRPGPAPRCLAGEMADFTRGSALSRRRRQPCWCRESARLDPGTTTRRPSRCARTSPPCATPSTPGAPAKALPPAVRALARGHPGVHRRARPPHQRRQPPLSAATAAALDGVEMLSWSIPDDRALEAARLEEFAASPQHPRAAAAALPAPRRRDQRRGHRRAHPLRRPAGHALCAARRGPLAVGRAGAAREPRHVPGRGRVGQ